MAHVATARKTKSRPPEAPVFDSPLARLLRAMRKATTPSLAEWSRRVGVSYLTAFRWERAGAIPERASIDQVVKVVAAKFPDAREQIDQAIREQRVAVADEPPHGGGGGGGGSRIVTEFGPTLRQHPRWPSIERYLLNERHVPPRTVEQTGSLPWVWDDYDSVTAHKVFDIIRAARAVDDSLT